MEVQVIKGNTGPKGKLKVAAYARVSVDEEENDKSIKNQILSYTELIQGNPDYEFVDVYYDYGVSGFKEDRPQFQRMMDDARSGKIDLIYTKSITRFARNTDTFLKAIRELKELGIGVFFELQNINSLTEAGELLMTIYAAFAQAESCNYSDLARITWQRKFKEGNPVYQIQNTLGYTLDENKKIVIVPEEAAWVKQIFIWVKQGYLPAQIIEKAKTIGITRKSGKPLVKAAIFSTIRNVVYKGDYIMQQTYVNEERKIRPNKGELPQYYIENNHPAIVSKKLWAEANRVIDERAAEKIRRVEIKPYTEENYPYKDKLYCAKCGNKLYADRSAGSVQRRFVCGGHRTYGDECCTGVSIPQKDVEAFGDITENIYISCDGTKPRQKMYSFVRESTWKKRYKKVVVEPVIPEYSAENYHYYKRIFCGECGSRLTRQTHRKNNKIVFCCLGRKEKGPSCCCGVTVPQEVLDRLPKTEGYFLIKEERKDGKKSYSYTSQKEMPVFKCTE